ncbi:hypothetical protein [Porphyromonas levii]|uniref:hypothetical protein n=1 Tax=Porphyromonas levii TaxID=28114 RepID=UPI00035D7834|nr:hypothetical protein [Porphyromonas levii]
MMDWQFITGTVLGLIGTPIAWLAGRKKANNDFLADLQSSIDLLSERNKDLLAEVVELRVENSTLQANQETLMQQLDALKEESEAMRELLKSMNIAIPRPRRRGTKIKDNE